MSVLLEKFADIKILKYKLPNFNKLSLKQKIYIYHLSNATLCGRDILFDQNNKWNLQIRKLLEAIYISFSGDRKSDAFINFHTYLKQIWFANGIHHHYSTEKFIPKFSKDELLSLLDLSEYDNNNLDELIDVIFNSEREKKRVSLNADKDLITTSAMNYYQGVNQQEAEEFYEKKRNNFGDKAPSFGLNSTLCKKKNNITEEVWSAQGKYSLAIKSIMFHLEQAITYTENHQQRIVIRKLIEFYETGDLSKFDDYSIAWVNENEGFVDFVNGFIEVYGDPLGIKGSWESIVNYKDEQATKRAKLLSGNAKWFEANSPVNKKYKKDEVKGVTAKVINVAMLGGDCFPATPIGINLPNSEWIREQYGSKSVTIENITQAYFADSLGNGMLEEFAANKLEIERAKKYGELASNLHTDLHECLGHGSGKMMSGVKPEDLKNYYSTIEETRADLFALYYIADPKLIEIGLVESEETAKAEFDSYIRNGLLTQLTRIELGKDLEESHMRNRQLIANWAFEKGSGDNVIEFFKKKEKIYVRINDYKQLRIIFGCLLTEIQRIKSEGDFNAAKEIVETYGVKIDKDIHAQVLERFSKLNIAPYAGFVNPEFKPIIDDYGNIVDLEISETKSYTEQMLMYSSKYSFL